MEEIPIEQISKWNLIFYDEFNGSSLDTTKWNTCYPNFQVGTDSCHHNNGELEIYQPSQVLVSNGILTLRAEEKPVTIGGMTFKYPSGMISSGPGANGSKAKFAFTYGFMKIRAKMPKGKGFWPAFWTLPTNGSWPPEIDVQEILGNHPTTVFLTYHWGTNKGASYRARHWSGPDFSAGWHTYATDWEPNAIIWYIDGIERFRYTNINNITSKPMYLLANLAVGGWPGSPNTSTPFPADYQIDYIRVWQKCTTNCVNSTQPLFSTLTPTSVITLSVWCAFLSSAYQSRRSAKAKGSTNYKNGGVRLWQ
jgi:beta-glucanase (GH16 family)